MLTVCSFCTREHAINPTCIGRDDRMACRTRHFEASGTSASLTTASPPGRATLKPNLERGFVPVKAHTARRPYNGRAGRRKPLVLQGMGLGAARRAATVRSGALPGGFARAAQAATNAGDGAFLVGGGMGNAARRLGAPGAGLVLICVLRPMILHHRAPSA
jgi:hypothetical protein